MKTLKFPDKLVSTENYDINQSIHYFFRSAFDEISEPKKISADCLSEKQITSSRKFKIALFAAYSSLIAIFGLIVYTAIVLDPRFPF